MRAAKSCTTTMAAMSSTAVTTSVRHDEPFFGASGRGAATSVRSAATRTSARRARATSRRAGSALARR